jgi:enediyne biosynthesis protein E4
MRHTISCVCFALFFIACKQTDSPKQSFKPIFEQINPKSIGIDFENQLPYTERLNCYLFKNFYNGGGVAIGDMNQDGLPDVFFCGNQASNRLYINKGNLQFEDITEKAGLQSQGSWTTGASWADVNGDGLLDLYVCKSGPPGLGQRKNQLFINKGNQTFEDQAAAYGVDVLGLSAHAIFFDYDRDGDTDFYLLSNSIRSVGGYDLREGQRNQRDPQGANKLFRNDGGHFTDVSAAAGIYGSNIGFGLGVAVGDYNRDGWQDMFVSNDFFERDYLYLNNRKGGFEEVVETAMPELSLGSMGADIADLNNDLYPEVFVTEMLPSSYKRYKTTTQFDHWNKFALMEQSGYWHQYSRNMLQLNQKNGSFSEIGRYAQVEATDWSWGALLADFDMDGWKDIFVANGIGKDLLDQDYIQFFSDPNAVREVLQNSPNGMIGLIDQIPSQPVQNAFYRNIKKSGIPQFEQISTAAGMPEANFSNGAAYSDLDNDGDLDLVINNLNSPPSILKNTRSNGINHWLTVVCKDTKANLFGIGSQVTIKTKDGYQFQEMSPMRGYQSCTDYRLTFGLGMQTLIDTLWCTFSSEPNKTYIKTNVKADQVLLLDILQEKSTIQNFNSTPSANFTYMPSQSIVTDYKHIQQYAGDFDREPLLYYMYATDGPALAVADINGDGLDDCYIGGGSGQEAAIFIQNPDESFHRLKQAAFNQHNQSNDQAAHFFDADTDGDLDLYVGSGCSDANPGDKSLGDRLYLNDGKGSFTFLKSALPESKPFGTAWVKSLDLNRDGAIDLIIGMRAVGGHYGSEAGVFVLMNQGKGVFRPDMSRLVGKPNSARMTTAADLADINADGNLDLIAAFDWGPICVFLQQNGKLVATDMGNQSHLGCWSALRCIDIDSDGDQDILAGNLGKNNRFKADAKQSMHLYTTDLDGNGTIDPIVAMHFEGRPYPLAQKADLVKQMPILKKHLLKSHAFAEYSLEQFFELMKPFGGSIRDSLTVNTLESLAFINDGNGKFMSVALPDEAQLFPIFAFSTNQTQSITGKPYIVLAGNQYYAKPEVGGNLAGYGLVIRYLGDQNWDVHSAHQTGLNLTGNVRGLAYLKTKRRSKLLAVRTNAKPLLYDHKVE